MYTLRNAEEKLRFVQSISFGASLNQEMKKADTKITRNKYRNGTSDEVNEIVNERFKDTYVIDKYEENGYEHIRLYNQESKHLYVLVREGTYLEQVDATDDDKSNTIHYLKAYAYVNRNLSLPSFESVTQLAFFDEKTDESVKEVSSLREYHIQKKVRDVIGDKDVEAVHVITYDVRLGNITLVKSRVPNMDIKSKPIYEEDLTSYVVAYNNLDYAAEGATIPKLDELTDEIQNQMAESLLKLKDKEKDNSEK